MKNKHKGFSLIELSIVLLIIGLMMSGLLAGVKVFQSRQIIEENRKKTERIQVAISDFILNDTANKNDPIRYPCPALLNSKANDPNFGMERCDLLDQNNDGVITEKELISAKSIEGIYILSGMNPSKLGRSNLVVLGALPVHSMGLTEQDALDVYKNRYVYAISLNQIENNYAALGTGEKPGAITIYNEGGGKITDSAQFFIYSTGEDGRGGYNSSGVKNTNCRETNKGDAQNCTWQFQLDKNKAPKAEFRTQSGFSKGNNEYYYDDYTIYTTYSLSDKENWWSGKTLDGENIHNTNPGKIWIGNNVGNIKFAATDRLVVDGQIRSIGKIYSEDNIVTDGRIGIGTTNPRTKLEVDGDIQIGNEEQSCSFLRAGSIRFNAAEKELELCNGSEWLAVLTKGAVQLPVSLSAGSSYTAEREGIVTATVFATTATPQNQITGFIDDQQVAQASAAIIPGVTTGSQSSLSFAVPKGSKLRVDATSASNTIVKWSQIGP